MRCDVLSGVYTEFRALADDLRSFTGLRPDMGLVVQVMDRPVGGSNLLALQINGPDCPAHFDPDSAEGRISLTVNPADQRFLLEAPAAFALPTHACFIGVRSEVYAFSDHAPKIEVLTGPFLHANRRALSLAVISVALQGGWDRPPTARQAAPLAGLVPCS